MLKIEELDNEEVEKEENFVGISDVVANNNGALSAVHKKNIAKQKLEEKLEAVVNAIEENNETSEEASEETVIDKIKKFISKIIEMQEEAKNEEEQEKQDKLLEEKEVEASKYLVEYYDLPYRYNETIVKILAQTPKKLFVYWDIADSDKQKYIDTFGENFFYKTYPVLLVYNQDKKYVKEVVINDFANSWYIDIDDPKTKYIIQLGRKFINYQDINTKKVEENNIILKNDYLPFADSNILEAPNDHVLIETLPRFVIFRNVKTNKEVAKDLSKFKTVLGKKYNVKEFYNNNYKDEISEGMFDMANPSSKLSSSMFK